MAKLCSDGAGSRPSAAGASSVIAPILRALRPVLSSANNPNVIHHIACGTKFFSDGPIRSLLANKLSTAMLSANGFKTVGDGPESTSGDLINWLTISDLRQSVIDDVHRIQDHPLDPFRIPSTVSLTRWN